MIDLLLERDKTVAKRLRTLVHYKCFSDISWTTFRWREVLKRVLIRRSL